MVAGNNSHSWRLFLRAIFRLFGDVQFGSTLYYVEVIACPVLLILSYLALFMNR